MKFALKTHGLWPTAVARTRISSPFSLLRKVRLHIGQYLVVCAAQSVKMTLPFRHMGCDRSRWILRSAKASITGTHLT